MRVEGDRTEETEKAVKTEDGPLMFYTKDAKGTKETTTRSGGPRGPQNGGGLAVILSRDYCFSSR